MHLNLHKGMGNLLKESIEFELEHKFVNSLLASDL